MTEQEELTVINKLKEKKNELLKKEAKKELIAALLSLGIPIGIATTAVKIYENKNSEIQQNEREVDEHTAYYIAITLGLIALPISIMHIQNETFEEYYFYKYSLEHYYEDKPKQYTKKG